MNKTERSTALRLVTAVVAASSFGSPAWGQPPPLTGCTFLPVIMDLNFVATPKDAFSIQLSWSGPPGVYQVNGLGFSVDVPSGTIDHSKPAGPQFGPGRDPVAFTTKPVSLTYTFARPQHLVLPDVRYDFEVRTTLPDGRIACDMANARTPRASITALPSSFIAPNDIRVGFELPPFVQELNIYRENYTDGRTSPAPRNVLKEPLGQASAPLRFERLSKGGRGAFDNRKSVNPGLPPLPADYNTPLVYELSVEAVWRDDRGRASSSRTVIQVQGPVPLSGWADLHTHPMSHLAFGGKVFHGAPDAGILLPARSLAATDPLGVDDCVVQPGMRATTILDALGSDSPTHGDPAQSGCGNVIRKALILGLEAANQANMPQPGRRFGAPVFDAWPAWHDVSHQKMWVDWIRRAYDGGLRVMVALSHNNRLLADIARGDCSNASANWIPCDDMSSSDLQIMEIKALVNRNASFMEVALSPADVSRIVRGNPAQNVPPKIAVVLGVEIDNIGNFCVEPAPSEQLESERCRRATMQDIRDELARLHSQGVRYIFPVHVTDNLFGGTAPYTEIFNAANFVETGGFWSFECAGTQPFPDDEIAFRITDLSAINQTLRWFSDQTGGVIPDQVPVPAGPAGCAPGAGFRNTRGLGGRKFTDRPPGVPDIGAGTFAIKEMMRMGFIVDVDHMSHRTAEAVLSIAESIADGGYPLMSGHNGIRDRANAHLAAENSRTRSQLDRIGCLGGMFGLGTSSAEPREWASQYLDALHVIRFKSLRCPNKELGLGAVALGTDANSLVKSPKPFLESTNPADPIRTLDVYTSMVNNKPRFPTSASPMNPAAPGGPAWDVRTHGVAHYGMYADFIKAVWTLDRPQGAPLTGQELVDGHLERNADNFWRMWVKVEEQKGKVRY